MLEDMIKNNPALQGMDPQKLQFILSFLQKDKPADMKSAMPFLLANMNLARKQNLRFSRPEIQLISEILSKDLPPAEQERVQKMLAMMQSLSSGSAGSS